jgi:hypothetical protein
MPALLILLNLGSGQLPILVRVHFAELIVHVGNGAPVAKVGLAGTCFGR